MSARPCAGAHEATLRPLIVIVPPVASDEGRPPSSQSGPKIAVPTRTIVAPSSIATRNRRSSHRQLGKGRSLAELSQRANQTRERRLLRLRRIAMRPRHPHVRHGRDSLEELAIRPVPRHPGRLAADSSPPPACPPRAAGPPALVELLRQLQRSSEWIRSRARGRPAPCSSGDARRGATGRATDLGDLAAGLLHRFSPSAGTTSSIAWRIRPTSTFGDPTRSTSSALRPARSAARATLHAPRSRLATNVGQGAG